MKICIWCNKNELEAEFRNLAHSIPKSLGGQNICENVCDKCNSAFGSHNNKLPPIETVLKETFNITRARFLGTDNGVGKNKPLTKFSSIYFDVNFKKNKIDLKPSFKFNPYFQESMARQMKRGLYKMFLEEAERQFGNGHQAKFDFIREFARFNLGDFPVYYFERTNGIIAMTHEMAKSPELFLEDDLQIEYLIKEPGFVEFEFLGHAIGLATSRNWDLVVDNYLKKSMTAKRGFFKDVKLIKKFNDFDLALSILN